jgi:hypothetical protein
MAKKVTKGFVLMIVVVLAISIQVVVEADNPFFSSRSLNHHPALTPFLHSPSIIPFSPYSDSRSKGKRLKKNDTPKELEE